MPEQDQHLREEECLESNVADKVFQEELEVLKDDHERAKSLMEKVFDAIRKERNRQEEKWGDQSGNTNGKWYTVLMEEAGEVAKALNDYSLHPISPKNLSELSYNNDNPESAINELRTELIHTAAVAVAWLEALES